MNKISNPRVGSHDEPLNSITADFAKTLKRIREGKRLTQHDLEEKSGLSLRMISDLERGLRQPTLRTLFKLAKGLGMTIMELIEQLLKEMGNH